MTNLMHALFGNGAAMQNAAMGQGILAQNTLSGVVSEKEAVYRSSSSKKVFHGMVEVTQVANGYIVNIGRKEGYVFETHIAANITEVNEIIAAQIVAFKLEDKS